MNGRINQVDEKINKVGAMAAEQSLTCVLWAMIRLLRPKSL